MWDNIRGTLGGNRRIMNKKLSSVLMLITTLILCCTCAFVSFAQTTTTSASGSIADAVQGALSDSGLSDAVNDVIGGIQDSGGISDVVGGISDRISGSLSDYSSLLDGILNGGSQSQTTTSAQVTQSFGNFALPNSPVQNNTPNRVTSAGTTAPAATAPTTAVPQTTAETKPTTAPNAGVTAAGLSTADTNESKGSGIWIFTAVVAAVIMVVVVTLIAVTGHTEFNSRVYDKSTIKSVRKTSASEVEFDDDEPMDNIMYAGARDKDSHGSRG